eukprot:1912665-Karenia_brevis.AAC.1
MQAIAPHAVTAHPSCKLRWPHTLKLMKLGDRSPCASHDIHAAMAPHAATAHPSRKLKWLHRS